MSSYYERKLRMIRLEEKLSQAAFAQLTGINIGTIKNYELGKRGVGLGVIEQVLKASDFKKYTLWLMLGEVNVDAGQVAPKLFLEAKDKIVNTYRLLGMKPQDIDEKIINHIKDITAEEGQDKYPDAISKEDLIFIFEYYRDSLANEY
ncbi:helix-turn-helix domain-containing protein [Providencia alcalifaciens]|uniref:helix-turn-helix domain-containing protein n=1 Tax=Providencia alcalifaciens TaxID=126385 RepID=UPI003D980900